MKTRLIYIVAAATAGACSSPPKAAAQTPVYWSIAPVRTALKTGSVADVKIDATIQSGWHIYSITQPAGGPIATRITIPDGQSFVSAGAATPSVKPHVAFDDAFRMNVQLHEKAVGFSVPIRVTGTGDSVHVNVRYQACNASLCLPPQTAKLAVAVARAK